MSLPTPTLHTTRLRLRPVSSADADALFAMHSNAYVLRYWDGPPWTERERAERFIAACRQMAADGSGARLVIERASDGAFLGWCGLTRWNPVYRSASLGYCLNEAAWGHGYATEAAHALLQWAFGALDLNRVQAETDTRNAASAGVLEKLGFLREGTLREDCVVDGVVSDSWVYGLLRRQWRASATSPAERDPWRRWDVLTTPMTQTEAQNVASFIGSELDGVDALVVRPGQNLRLVWDRESVEMLLDALTAYRATGGAVPPGIIDNLEHWLHTIADH